MTGPSAGPSKLRVLHVIGDLDLGGAETLLYRLATWPNPKIEHEVICLGGPGWYSSRLEENGVPVRHLGMTGLASTASAALGLRRHILDSRANVVQSWMYLANVLSSGVARRAGIPVVWGIHNSSLENVGHRSRVAAYIGGLTSRWLPSFVINCSAHSARLHAKYGYSAATGAIIPNGYDPSAFFPSDKARAATRKSLKIDDRTFVIGSITRWHSQKDVPTLIRALGLLRERPGRMMGLLIGRGLEEGNAELSRQLEAAGLGDMVRPLGRRSDIRDLARAMDIHVLASRTEAFPNVIAETMLSGTPNVVTDVGDSALIVGDTGWSVAAGNPERLADAIEEAYCEWASRPKQWQKRRSAARERIAENFAFERMAEAYEQVWANFARNRV